MHRKAITLVFLALFAASSVFAISPSDDLLIAGAARTNKWTADLYINNPGASGVTVEVSWFHRDPLLTNPAPASFAVAADETLILDDVVLDVFGYNRASGAIRVTASGGEVTANLIVFTTRASDGATYGSGFEGIPASSATSAGESTALTGMVLNDDFYTNLFALAGASGATMDVDLLDPDGDLLDTTQVVLDAYAPWFSAVVNLWDLASFENGTALVQVSAGSMVMLGSKVDRLSADPTTVEQAFGAGGGSVDGSYQFAVYDSLGFASGGNLLIEDDDVFPISGTYVNYDKVDNGGVPECPVIFQWGFELAATALEDYATGVEWDEVYDPGVGFDGGTITYTLTFTFDDGNNLGFSGTLDAEGSEFTGLDLGCNGTFPQMAVYGGKSN
jgi:hypothetical protein